MCSGEGTSVVVCDINPSMLQVGQQRARDKAYGDDDPGLSWVEGNAEKLVCGSNETPISLGFRLRLRFRFVLGFRFGLDLDSEMVPK